MGRGGVSPTHFFYEMRLSEAAAYLRGLDLRDRSGWERTRWLMYATLKPWCKDLDGPTNVLKFGWESEESEDTFDEKSLPGLRGRAKEFEKIMLTNRSENNE